MVAVRSSISPIVMSTMALLRRGYRCSVRTAGSRMIFVSDNVAADAAGKTVAPSDINRRGKCSPTSKGLGRGRGDPRRHRQDHDVPDRPEELSGLRRGTRNICAAPLAAPSDKAPDRSAPRRRLGLPVGEPRVWQQWPRPGRTGAKSSLERTAWEHPHVRYSAKNSRRVYVQNLRLATRRKRRLAEADQPTPQRDVIKYP
jgi:hypothetical protein